VLAVAAPNAIHPNNSDLQDTDAAAALDGPASRVISFAALGPPLRCFNIIDFELHGGKGIQKLIPCEWNAPQWE